MVMRYGLPVIAAVRVIRRKKGWSAACMEKQGGSHAGRIRYGNLL
jgi:hypothetical protein